MGIKQLFKTGDFIDIKATFRNWTCHQHKRFIIWGQMRDKSRRSDIAQNPPRKSQILSLQEEKYDPFSTKRQFHVSHSQSKSIRHQVNYVDLPQKVLQMQKEDCEAHLHEANVSMTNKGRIHLAMFLQTYSTVSIWSTNGMYLYLKLAKFDEPGVFIDATEDLVANLDGRKVNVYKMRIPSPCGKGFITPWQCIVNRKQADQFVTSFTTYHERLKSINDGQYFSPKAITCDGWPPFLNTSSKLFNGVTLQKYLCTEHQRMSGMPNVPKNKTTLILGLRHILQNVRDTFDYGKSEAFKLYKKDDRILVKVVAEKSIWWIAESYNLFRNLDCIQMVNIITKQKKFHLKNIMDFSSLLWTHDVLCPNPSLYFDHCKNKKFLYDTLGKYYCLEIFHQCQLFVMYRAKKWSLRVIFMGDSIGSLHIDVQNYSFDNPYYMPVAAEYMNKNKYDKMALFSVLSIGERKKRTNQFIEGTFNVDKNHNVSNHKLPRLDAYIQSELECETAVNQQYVQECLEFKSKKLMEELDQTRKSKVAMTEQELHLKEEFSKLILIYFKGNYNRENVIKDWNEFHQNDLFAPELTLQKVSALKTRDKKISTYGNFIGYVEKWLKGRLNGA